MKLALAAIALAACSDPPPLTIDYTLATDGQVCTGMSGGSAQSCLDVALPCDTYMSLRIVDPAEPTHAYLSVCQPVTGLKDLCSIAGIGIPAAALPAQTLEVEVAIYPTSELVDADGDGLKDCPLDPLFANGLPVPQLLDGSPIPAIGGAAYYHVGDVKTTVPLGCTSQDHLDGCLALDTIEVTATAVDFDTDLTASDTLANELELFVGEPKVPANGNLGEFVLAPGQTTPLTRTPSQIPSWSAADMQAFDQFACVEVLDESTTVITPVLTCQSAGPSSTMLDFAAARIAPATLQKLLIAATMLPGVPAIGITIGVVLDETGEPIGNAMVTSSSGKVQYVTADGLSLVDDMTTVNGIFVSLNAGFGTTFTLDAGTHAIGGLVDGKVTAVVLQHKMPMGN
jgi:uncharacterized membrane protein (DUF441 family)